MVIKGWFILIRIWPCNQSISEVAFSLEDDGDSGQHAFCFSYLCSRVSMLGSYQIHLNFFLGLMTISNSCWVSTLLMPFVPSIFFYNLAAVYLWMLSEFGIRIIFTRSIAFTNRIHGSVCCLELWNNSTFWMLCFFGTWAEKMNIITHLSPHPRSPGKVNQGLRAFYASPRQQGSRSFPAKVSCFSV